MFSDLLIAPEPRILALFGQSVAHFRSAIKLLDAEVKIVDIPHQNGETPLGYLH
jgi:hypothetical protein